LCARCDGQSWRSDPFCCEGEARQQYASRRFAATGRGRAHEDLTGAHARHRRQ
jgi:hypothetical protein